jgi:prepilin-type N-terminal cleavage/methylation domain-containing protein
MRRRAFTLLELSIALAMAGIVVAAAAATGVTVSRILKLEAKKSHADADSRRLVDFLLTNIQAVGGGPVRPWMATWLESQNCPARPNGSLGPCDGRNDRLTLVDVDPGRRTCTMVSMTSSQIVFEGPDSATGLCCFHWPGLPPGTGQDQYEGQPLMIVTGRDRWAVHIGSGDISTPGTCVYGLTGVDPLQGWTGTPGNAPVPSATFGNGSSVTPVVIRTLFVESDGAGAPRLPRLVEWQDGAVDGTSNGEIDTGEVRLVFPGVVSFHAALGYDSAPVDGAITTTGGTTDEWFGNATGDTLTGLRAVDLRMAEVGVVTAVGAVEPGPRTFQVLDGGAITSDRLMLRRAASRTYLRNVAVFF